MLGALASRVLERSMLLHAWKLYWKIAMALYRGNYDAFESVQKQDLRYYRYQQMLAVTGDISYITDCFRAD